MKALRTLLHSLIDYAGLFPPSALSMAQAAGNYARYRNSPEVWMLGRFVVPVTRLDELNACSSADGWSLSAIAGGNTEADLARIARFNVDAIEMKVDAASQIEKAMGLLPAALTPYFEISDLALVKTIRSASARAKIRTGGVTPDAFPQAGHIARFLEACARTGTPFKATAGLHHPLRGYRPLTYSANGPSGWMFGFLNVFIAAILARKGLSADQLAPILMEESPSAFRFSETALALPEHTASIEEIAAARRDFAISFGSCSFEEPIADLKTLNLL